MTPMRRLTALVLGVLVTVLSAGPVAAESALWTLGASPLAATTGTPTTFTLTATNLDLLADLSSSSRIGCVRVDVPANFSIASAQVTGSSTGSTWSASVAGNRVSVTTSSGGDRLRTGDWVRFTVRATAASVGSLAWASRAFERTDCGGLGALLGAPPIVVVTGPTVTPTPVPTPIPTPVPTPVPTQRPTPTPVLPLPTGLPTLPPIIATPTPTATPTARATPSNDPARPTPTASSSDGPRASDAPDETPRPSGGTAGGAGGGTGGNGTGGPVVPPIEGGGAGPRVLVEPADVRLGGAGVGILSGIDVWIVPGAAIGGPGLLILLWILLQAVGAFAWLPAVRRLRGDDEARPAAA